MYAPNVARDVASTGAPFADVTVTPRPPVEPRNRRERLLRSEIKALVGKVAHRAGIEPKQVNTDLLKRGLPKREVASLDDLERTYQVLAVWLEEVS